MVNVGQKDYTIREATARGSIFMKKETLQQITSKAAKKGDVDLLKVLVDGAGGKEEGARALLTCREATGKTSLHFAAAMGRKETCAYILEIAPNAYAEKDEQGKANVPRDTDKIFKLAEKGGNSLGIDRSQNTTGL